MSDHPLKTYRDGRKLTQEQLAAELDVSGVTVSRWETGKRQIDRHLLLPISQKTGIPPRDLRPDLAEILGAVG